MELIKLEKDIKKLKELGLDLVETDEYNYNSLGKQIYNEYMRRDSSYLEIDISILGNSTFLMEVYETCPVEGGRTELRESITYSYTNKPKIIKLISNYIAKQKHFYATQKFKKQEKKRIQRKISKLNKEIFN